MAVFCSVLLTHGFQSASTPLLGFSGATGAERASYAISVAEGNTAFAVDLYHRLRGQEGNLFFSPYNISAALALAYAGARGETESQMARTLHFPSPQAHFHPAFSALQASLQSAEESGDVQIHVANSLWPQRGVPIEESFLRLLKSNYNTPVNSLDYGRTEAARQTINDWAKQKTQDKVQDLIPPGLLGSDTVLVMANAIYFSGNWLTRFDESSTREAPFSTDSGQTVTAPMMNRQGTFALHADTDVQVLELPYAGQSMSMLVLLPVERDGLARLEKGLNLDSLKKWIGELRDQTVQVALPRFKIGSSFLLNEKLKSMGMKDAFGPKADFSGMNGTGGIWISAALHQACVEVTEQGSEGEAATAVVLKRGAPPKFLADHPFLVLMRDKRSDTILFMGRIVDPTK